MSIHKRIIKPNDAKCARVERMKKQHIERITAEHAAMIQTVKILNKIFHTMDEYGPDLQFDDYLDDDACGLEQPAQPPPRVNYLADELKRFCETWALQTSGSVCNNMYDIYDPERQLRSATLPSSSAN
jgi:hypothetical protein